MSGIALAFTLLDPTHDHRDAKLWQMPQNVLRFGIRLDGLSIESLFERMQAKATPSMTA
ncbi:hypothetical protein G8O24_14910 [Bradyrhizobium sp. INPA01-394B]|uniref:Uncharacterized protein n=1 Tax=Bradyrhizobium campsiandrae TaxID=1729892 RepID=A0ABR7UAI7_9BRAD|nr:hypothetical protein [Bradyrhizobium campsiandrae]MBC9878631.1 hypothetical protein [Bradyrhizobium campsiandrae]MBC9980640.1 hypothetical protein [Bradyrhizobium campsiandrae]